MNKGFYLLCDLGVPNDSTDEKPRHYKFNFPKESFSARSIYLIDKNRCGTSSISDMRDGRFIFWFKNKSKNDVKAQMVSDALIANIQLIYQMAVVPPNESPLPYWFDNTALSTDYILNISQFKKNNPVLYLRLGYSAIFPRPIVNMAWKILSITLHQPFFDAIHFHQASIREYCFLGDDELDVIRGYITSPISRFDFVRAENAVINAFKSIEAIIGDPPKNEIKFRKKLADVGINPDELFGLADFNNSHMLEPIGKKIRKYNDMRDKRAAHGRSTINRHITYYDILEIQECARVIIFKAIEYCQKKHNASLPL